MQDRANILLKIADRIEANLEKLAVAETDNGKAVRETLNADVPLAADHFRYFAGCIRAGKAALQRSTSTPRPITSMSRWAWSGRSSRGTSPLMAAWKLAPALAAGNCIVLAGRTDSAVDHGSDRDHR